jgi:hypothetical protein
MSSGDTSQRMELLIIKSGPRITPARAAAGIHIITRACVLIVVIVKATDPMLPSFCNDLVEGCNSWQT